MCALHRTGGRGKAQTGLGSDPPSSNTCWCWQIWNYPRERAVRRLRQVQASESSMADNVCASVNASFRSARERISRSVNAAILPSEKVRTSRSSSTTFAATILRSSNWCLLSVYFAAFFAAAQRAFCAAAILARASSLNTRLADFFAGEVVVFFGRPGPRLTGAATLAELPVSRARACCSLLISSSSAERIPLIIICKV